MICQLQGTHIHTAQRTNIANLINRRYYKSDCAALFERHIWLRHDRRCATKDIPADCIAETTASKNLLTAET
jgi:hypothetical protein